MDVVIADEKGRNVRQLSACRLDCAFGVDENDLVFSCHPLYAPKPGYRVYVMGTEFGGVVDAVKTTVRGERREIECRGRTWHGILAGKRLVPDAGTSHIRATGTVGDALADLVRRCGLESLFKVEPNAAAVDYAYERFCDAWSGLLDMLRSSSMRPSLRYRGGCVVLSAVPSRTVGGRVDSNIMDFDIDSVHRCVNHLVCGGTGENENRTIVHFYADADGAVSHEQSLFGVDEIAAFYDYSNADEEKLEEEGRKKLAKLQTSGEIDVDARDGFDAGIGDAVTARDNATGTQLTAMVEKKIAVVSDGTLTVSYELGKPSIGTSAGTMSGTAESSGGGSTGGGGREYFAGEGLRLTGYTFSADVTQSDLDAVNGIAEAARKSASDAEATAGAAMAEAAGKAPAKHGHQWSDVSGAPSSYPPAPHRHQWGDVDGKPATFAPAPHTHAYAGAATAGGPATSAARLETPRRITLTGAVTGAATFDGAGDVSIVTTGDAQAAGFLAAHPVGFFVQTAGADPNDYGGRWECVPAIGPDTWIRKE